MADTNWRALIGLFITLTAMLLLGLQSLRISRSRSKSGSSPSSRSTTQRIFDSFRKDATVFLGWGFLIFCLAMEVAWIFDETIAAYCVVFRHMFFLAWVAIIMRQWFFVLDPLHRIVSKSMFESLWLFGRIVLLVVMAMLTVLLASGTIRGQLEEYNSIVWLATSVVVIPSCCFYMLYLRNVYALCQVSLERNADVIGSEDVQQAVRNLLGSRAIDMDVLKRQDGVAHLLGISLQISAIKNLFGFFITLVALSFFHEILWVLARAYQNEDPEAAISEKYGEAVTSVYCWLPQFLPFVYWVLFILPPGRVFIDNSPRKSSLRDGSVTRLSQVVYVNRKQMPTSPRDSELTSVLSEPSSEIDQTHSIPHSGYLAWVGAELIEMGKDMYFSETSETWTGVLNKIMRESDKGVRRDTSISDPMVYADNIYDRCREIHVACSEALILDKQSELPIAAMFSGHSTFAVLSAADSRSADPEWTEVGRSDLQSERLNPDFSTNFIVPLDERKDRHRLWRVQFYNVLVKNPSFSVKDSKLSNNYLVGVVYFCADEIVQKTPKFFDFDAENAESVDNYCELIKPIVMRRYDPYSLRFGGGCVLRIRNIDLYCRYIPMLLPSRRPPAMISAIADASPKTNGRSLSRGSGSDVSKVVIKPMVLARSFLIHSNSHSCASIAAGISDDLHRRDIYVREECVESPYSITVPIAFLKALFVRRQREAEAYAREAIFFDNDVWIAEILRKKEELLNEYTNAIDYYLTEGQGMSFKSSKLKDSFDLRFVPNNLHLQMLLSNMDFRNERGIKCGGNYENKTRNKYVAYDIVTVGAFAAHPLKFKKGGVWHFMNKLEKRRLEIEESSSFSSGPTYVSCTEVWHMKKLPWDETMHELAFEASKRIDICLAQCLSALVTGFLAKIQLVSATSTPSEMENLCALGMLVQFESLLSTQGKELGMLADMYCAVRCLDNVQFQIHCNSNKGNIPASVGMYWKGEGTKNEVLIVDLGVNEDYFNTLPSIIQEGNTIPVVPVMFTVGVNELQSLANASSPNATHLQDVINAESVSRVCEYVQLLQKLADGQFHQTIQPLEESFARELSISSYEGSDFPRASGASMSEERLTGPSEKGDLTDDPSLRTSTPTKLKNADPISLKIAAHRVILLRQIIMATDAGRNLNSGRMFVNVDTADEEKLRLDSTASHTTLDVNSFSADTHTLQNSLSTDAKRKRAASAIEEVSKEEEEEEDDDEEDEDVLDTERPSMRASRSVRSGSIRPIGDVLLNLGRRESFMSHTSAPRLSIMKAPQAPPSPSNVEMSRLSVVSVDSNPGGVGRHSVISSTASSNSQAIPALPDMLEEPNAPAPPYPSGVQFKRPESARITRDSDEVVNPMSSDNPAFIKTESQRNRSEESVSSPLREKSSSDHFKHTHSSVSKRPSTAKNLMELNRLFNKLNEQVRTSTGMGGKPIQILFAAAKLTRAVDGIRLTSCKSGKDRTGMSVTYEEANIIKERYKIADNQYEELLETLRVDGVRLRNAEKNIGKAKFAFNAFQRKFLPDEFVPPLSTIGSVQS